MALFLPLTQLLIEPGIVSRYSREQGTSDKDLLCKMLNKQVLACMLIPVALLFSIICCYLLFLGALVGLYDSGRGESIVIWRFSWFTRWERHKQLSRSCLYNDAQFYQ
jgi:hypothetical protein